MRNNRKHLDFEINLIPCIDLLSVCICFLLLTAVWLQVGSLNVKQAIGGQSLKETEKKPELWVNMGEGDEVTLNLKQSTAVPKKLTRLKVKFSELGPAIQQLKGLDPTISTVLIQPLAASAYEQIIALMDEFKKAGMTDLGVVPL